MQWAVLGEGITPQVLGTNKVISTLGETPFLTGKLRHRVAYQILLGPSLVGIRGDWNTSQCCFRPHIHCFVGTFFAKPN